MGSHFVDVLRFLLEWWASHARPKEVFFVSCILPRPALHRVPFDAIMPCIIPGSAGAHAKPLTLLPCIIPGSAGAPAPVLRVPAFIAVEANIDANGFAMDPHCNWLACMGLMASSSRLRCRLHFLLQ
jgi:hypothetical protein